MGHPTIDFHKSRQTAVEGRAAWEREFEQTHKSLQKRLQRQLRRSKLKNLLPA